MDIERETEIVQRKNLQGQKKLRIILWIFTEFLKIEEYGTISWINLYQFTSIKIKNLSRFIFNIFLYIILQNFSFNLSRLIYL